MIDRNSSILLKAIKIHHIEINLTFPFPHTLIHKKVEDLRIQIAWRVEVSGSLVPDGAHKGSGVEYEMINMDNCMTESSTHST